MSPLELTNAYTSFHDGNYQPARAITKVTDQEGKVLYKWKDRSKEIWNKRTVAKMRHCSMKQRFPGQPEKPTFLQIMSAVKPVRPMMSKTCGLSV